MGNENVHYAYKETCDNLYLVKGLSFAHDSIMPSQENTYAEKPPGALPRL